MKKYTSMERFVPPEPHVIEPQPQTIVVPSTVYIIVLGCIILIGALSGAYLTMVSDWSRVAIAVAVILATVILIVISMVILSGNLPAVLQYRAFDRHDKRTFTLEMERIGMMERPQLPTMNEEIGKAREWMRMLYGPDGKPSRTAVQASGYLIASVPWSSRERHPDGLIIKEIVTAKGMIQTDGRNYLLNQEDYPTWDSIREALP